MTDLEIVLEEQEATVTVRLIGVIDRRSAHELRRLLATVGVRELVIDFSGVRQFEDLAAGVLASALAPCKPRVRVQGLADHPARLLRYCGLGEDGLPRRGYYQPEDPYPN